MIIVLPPFFLMPRVGPAGEGAVVRCGTVAAPPLLAELLASASFTCQSDEMRRIKTLCSLIHTKVKSLHWVETGDMCEETRARLTGTRASNHPLAYRTSSRA